VPVSFTADALGVLAPLQKRPQRLHGGERTPLLTVCAGFMGHKWVMSTRSPTPTNTTSQGRVRAARAPWRSQLAPGPT